MPSAKSIPLNHQRLVLGGKQLEIAPTLANGHADEKINPSLPTTLHLVLRLRGGGADGGTAATNRNYLRAADLGKTKAKSRSELDNQRAEKLTTCALSGAPLVAPICADKLGYLYNKEAVIHFLLQDKAVRQADKKFKHIRKLKSVVECDFTSPIESSSSSSSSSSSYSSSSTTGETKADSASIDPNILRAVCPVTLRPMNKKHPFVVLWKTGKVYSAQAVRELPEACGLVTGHQEIVIPLGPSAAKLETLKERLQSTKKRKRKANDPTDGKKSSGGSASSSSSSSTGSGSGSGTGTSAAAKKKKTFKSAKDLFTTGFGFGQ